MRESGTGFGHGKRFGTGKVLCWSEKTCGKSVIGSSRIWYRRDLAWKVGVKVHGMEKKETHPKAGW